MLDGDAAPAKRLRYSPESKHAPKSKASHLDQGHVTVCASQPSTARTSPSRSSGSVATLAELDTASEHANAPHAAAISTGLRASAAPWIPALNSIWSNVSEPGREWQSGFGNAAFGAIKPLVSTNNGATGLLSPMFSCHDAQVQNMPLLDLLHQNGVLLTVNAMLLQVILSAVPISQSRRGANVHPLQGSSLANTEHDNLFHADVGLNFAPALPANLFTPPKQPNNASSQRSSQLLHSPAVRVSSHSAQYNLFDQSQDRVSLSTTATPTSIFRRLKTSSPEDTAEQHSQCKFNSYAYSQNVDPRSAALARAPSGLSYIAPVPQKRSRPVQRGIHPAEINKRITGARESWQILDIVNTFGAEFDAVNVATALHRIAKQRPDDVPQLIDTDAFKQLVVMVDVQVTFLLHHNNLVTVCICFNSCCCIVMRPSLCRQPVSNEQFTVYCALIGLVAMTYAA